MIVGGRIDRVEAARDKDTRVENLNIKINIDDVKVKNEDIELKYTYVASYETGVGHIKIEGRLYAKEDKKLAKNIEESWNKTKKGQKLPVDYASMILTAINYTGSANGTLIARVLNLTAPLVPPQLKVDGKK